VNANRSSQAGAAPSPAAIVDALDRSAKKLRTPCGDGSMVWRVWGSGEPLLLFHGGSGSWTHWLRNIAALSRHHQLWVPDLPGLGQSAMPPQPLIPATVADIIVAGLDQLLPGAGNLRLVGFSFGGHIAGLTAARLGERIGTLTLVGVAALGLAAEPREPFAKQRAGMSAEQIAAVFQQNLRVLMFANPDNIERARFRSRPFALTDGLARALADVTATLQTIWGTQDIIARGSLDTRLEILRRHHRELEVRLIENAGHWVAYEAADRFNEALLELLAAPARAASS
jgi:2-hydroxy-6-oxonona-2,4-dienedioate hydrolase